jgi:hypothetical protein
VNNGLTIAYKRAIDTACIVATEHIVAVARLVGDTFGEALVVAVRSAVVVTIAHPRLGHTTECGWTAYVQCRTPCVLAEVLLLICTIAAVIVRVAHVVRFDAYVRVWTLDLHTATIHRLCGTRGLRLVRDDIIMTVIMSIARLSWWYMCVHRRTHLYVPYLSECTPHSNT